MKITYHEKEYELRYSFRALMIYENITGKSFQPQSLTDIIIFFYATLLGVTKDNPVKYDDFLDWLDENPAEVNNFSQWLMDVFGLNEKLTPKKETPKKERGKKNVPN